MTAGVAASGNRCVPTGLAGLDYILGGGYASNRVHLLEGRPGTGKTTMALQFLCAGSARGESGLYISFSESEQELRTVAALHGMSLTGIRIVELIAPEADSGAEQRQAIVYAAELELVETMRQIIDLIIAARPALVVIDSLSDIRLLAESHMRYRSEILALKQFFFRQDCTVLLLDDLSHADEHLMLQSVGHGVVRLEQSAPTYGAERRRLHVPKMRGREISGGYHDMVIRQGGAEVFPRLVAEVGGASRVRGAAVKSGLSALDAQSGGGLDRGTTTLILGPSGAGKSTLALRLLTGLLDAGECAIFISFDETRANFERRALGIGLDVQRHLDNGGLDFIVVDPALVSPGELAAMIRHRVAAGSAAVVLDSLSGYQHAMPDEVHLLLQLHELVTYLNQLDVVTILTVAAAGLVGPARASIDITYLADSVFLMRFFEAGGRIRRALSMIKKRTGWHEQTIREIAFTSDGVHIGTVLEGFTGMLADVPVFTGKAALLGTG